MLNKEIISEVRNDLRSADYDSWLPAKYIYMKLKGVASLFIKREADDKRLFRYSGLWSTIKCLEMEERDLIECCDIQIPNCTKVMISKEKLPEVYTTRFGYLFNITSLDYNKDYLPTTPEQFKYTQIREFNDPRKRYYWIENEKIVVPKTQATQLGPIRLTVKGLFMNKAQVRKLDQCSESKECALFMDQDFVAPEHLLQDIKSATVIAILKSNKQIVPDELSNLNQLVKTSAQQQ